MSNIDIIKCNCCNVTTKCFLVNKEFEGRIFKWLCRECKSDVENAIKVNEMDAKSKEIMKGEKGKKFDTGKPEWDLLYYPFLEDVVKVMMLGKQKYGFENWKKDLEKRRIINALFRHLIAYLNGEIIDKESGYSHLTHIVCNAMFLYYYDSRVSDGKK